MKTENHILGYYFWSWSIDNDGNSTQFIAAPGWKDLDQEFQVAVTGWNNWAPTSAAQDESGAPTGASSRSRTPKLDGFIINQGRKIL